MAATAGWTVFLTFLVGVSIGIGLGIIGLLLGKLVSPSKELPRKKERYECANPPKGRARGWFMMQYYPYLIIFLTIEPIMIFSFLFLLEAHVKTLFVSALFAVILGVLIPPLVFGLSSARRLELWSAD